MGYRTTAKGYYSTAMGNNTTAYSYAEVAAGQWNTVYTPSSVSAWKTNDRLFVIGNGYTTKTNNITDTIKSDALIVYKNGNSEFGGSVTPKTDNSYTLGKSGNRWKEVWVGNSTLQTSDKRLKTNIKPLEKALDKVLTLNGVTYEWRVKEFPDMNFDSNRHVGVLAQEVEAVLPEAVETGEDGYKSVKYSEITPLLIEAMKELKAEKDAQDKKIEALEAEKEAQGKKIEALEAQLKEILEKMQ
jgi:hypothetical protein